MALNASNSSKYYKFLMAMGNKYSRLTFEFSAQKRMMDKKFMFVQNLRNVKIKIQRDDFTVLMAIIFCIKGNKMKNNNFMEIILKHLLLAMPVWALLGYGSNTRRQ
jgi:hypothetical protein